MKKIEYAVGAAGLFIRHLHRDNFDRCMLATFGNSFRVEQSFTANETQLQTALSRISRSITNEATRLYDSIEDVIWQFRKYGDPRRPWLLTIITDGKEYFDGGKYKNNPAGIGRFIATHFNHEASNFVFVIGVGEGNQIDENALAIMGDYGNFPALTIGGFPLLEMLFLRIALEVSEQIEGIQVNYGNISWREVSRVRQISNIPFDYAFLLDRSGSMGEQG